MSLNFIFYGSFRWIFAAVSCNFDFRYESELSWNHSWADEDDKGRKNLQESPALCNLKRVKLSSPAALRLFPAATHGTCYKSCWPKRNERKKNLLLNVVVAAMHTIQFLSSLVCEWALELPSRARKEKKFLWIHAGTRACAADVDVKVAPRKRSRKKWRKKISLQERTMAKTGLTTFSTFIAGLMCCSWLSRNAKLVQWGRARWCWFGVFGPQVLSEITFYAFRSLE